MGDGRQLWAAPEPDIDVVLRDGSELALPTGDELVPALDDEFSAVAAATAAAAIPATSVATPSIFPIVATGTATAAAVATTATAATTTIAGVILDIGLVHSDTVASSHATLLSPSARHR